MTARSGPRSKYAAAAAAFLALTVALCGGGGQAHAAFPGANGKIAFQSSRASGNFDIWVMEADGSGPTRLTSDIAEDWVPTFSPDGSRIAFGRTWNGIWVMNADGSGQTRLGDGAYPAWSPDGSQIVYSHAADLWIMNADGSGARQLTESADGPGGADSQPAWSPDGTKIAFERGGDLWIVNADGSGATQLVELGTSPAWAPDSSAIVFDRWAGPDGGISLVRPDGSGLARLAPGDDDHNPAFSPDGSKIVFMSGGRVDNYELFTMNADGSGIARLTNEFPAYEDYPDWQPIAVPPAPAIAIGDASVAEGNTGATTASFEVSLSSASAERVDVAYSTGDGTATAPGDYATASGTVTFAAGETQKTIAVAVAGDTFDEPDETFFVDLSQPANATVTDDRGVGTIVDDDEILVPPTPSVSIGDARSTEGHGGITTTSLELTLSAATTAAVEVAYATADGTATAPGDYAAASGTVTFAPGETRKSIAVSVVGDTIDEPDETFFVNLSEPENGTIADAQGAGTIVDDDGPVFGHTLVGTVSTLTSFAPGAGSLADRAPLAGVRVIVYDGVVNAAGPGGGRRVAETTSDAAGAFQLSGLPACGPRGCSVEFVSGRSVLGSELVSFAGRTSVTTLAALVRRQPERSFLGGTVELVGAGDPGAVEVRVYADGAGAGGKGAPSPEGLPAGSGTGSPGEWRLEIPSGRDAPRRLRVVLFADGVAVDEELVSPEGLETRVPALQLRAAS